MTEEDIERGARSDPDNPLIEPTEWKVIEPPRKQSIHLRVDADVLEWFRANSTRHLTHMNAVLRQFVQAKIARGRLRMTRSRSDPAPESPTTNR